jgi:ribulose-phosphate 3-epimerase
MLVAPSLLSADFGNLQRDVEKVCESGADLLHVDVMDGHFVPNLTIGPVVVSSVAKTSSKPLDIHLMVENNTFFVELFAKYQPKYISFHIEEEKHPHRLIQKIREYGISPAIALNPHSRVETIEHLIEDIDMVLIMSVNPGFGGQRFINNSTMKKIEQLDKMRKEHHCNFLIEVDGGVSNKNIEMLRSAGVDVAVSGSYIFKSESVEEAIRSLK